jgi:hypothetical protein
MRLWLIGFSLLLLFHFGCKSKDKDAIPVPVPISPMTVQVTTPSSPQTGEITISYSLIDERVPPVNADIKVEYSANGWWFQEATEGSGGDGTTNLSTATSPGAAHTFVWDSTADLGMGLYSVIIKITPYDTSTTDWGAPGQTNAFQVVIALPAATAQFKVMDPKMPGSPSMDLQYRVDPAGISFTMTVKVVSVATGGEVRRLVDAQSQAGGINHLAAWDGKNYAGKFVDPGDYEVVVEGVYQSLPVWSGTETVHIVRLGVAGVEFVSNGAGSEEYQLMYHIRNSSKYTYYAIPDSRAQWAIGPDVGDLSDLDTDDGLARPLPALWTDLNSPPQDTSDAANVEDDNYNLPVCYHRAALPKFQLTLGSSAVSNSTPNTAAGCGYPITGLPIRVVAGGAVPETPGANEDMSPGGAVDFVSIWPLLDAVQKNNLSFTFTFEYQDGGIWYPIAGSVTTEHTVYTIYDKPMLTDSATPVAPYLPWVSVVDIVCDWVNGFATADSICSTVTSQVNTFFGLQYDTSIGARHYTTGGWSTHDMEMSDFIEDYGASSFTVLNCSDCACLLATFANTVGVDHKYQILGVTSSIPLNYMIPIGRDWMVPFSGSFSYHAVSTKDDGTTISDTCCTLDNDADPSSPPHVPILPVNMVSATYKIKLSSSPGSWGTYTRARCGQH